jgi:hypothetical protein
LHVADTTISKIRLRQTWRALPEMKKE